MKDCFVYEHYSVYAFTGMQNKYPNNFGFNLQIGSVEILANIYYIKSSLFRY